MRWPVLACLFLAVACNVPSPAFRGIAPTRISVEQSTFDVRITGRHAQAIRVNAEWAPRMAAVAPRAAAAIAAVSGCDAPRLWGDQAMIEAVLVCTPAARAAKGVARPHVCRAVPTRQRWTEMACQPVAGEGPRDFSMKIELGASG
ncbi:hypothetical protein [Roseovarius autotrophicus]|uniref:hypothetical protein n=1 Tax=Roseovarius autotrophicus TaxID=2824121 RepID=UPI001B369398|nr:hypothetical protein [Roseovarius autotrophicus]